VTKTQKEEEAKVLQQYVRKELLAVVKDPKKRLIYIDAIERLGVAYHFEEEIEANLQNFHNNEYDDAFYKDDLQYVSLQFRILRQRGFYVSCDAFNKFRDEKGSFKSSLTSDLQGLLKMHEAAYLRVKGDDILDEALEFSTLHLKSMATQLNPVMTKQVKHALSRPLHKCTPRLESRYQISFYADEHSHDKNLLKLAKLDFDLLQVLHRKELQQLTRWWKNLNLAVKLPFTRDRLVEAYFWILGVYYEPNYSLARIIFTKVFIITSVIDDTYDAYGTMDELETFTEAIQWWDKNYALQLPEYMKIIYEALLDTFEQFKQDLLPEARTYAVEYLQQEMKELCNAYMQEARWCHTNYMPTYDEYIKNGIISGAYLCMIAASYQGMGQIANNHAFEWLRQRSKALTASCILARLLNDIGSSKVCEYSYDFALLIFIEIYVI
ncbi:Sesquiterpene synthase, partial [Bienertia sinuspersici]